MLDACKGCIFEGKESMIGDREKKKVKERVGKRKSVYVCVYIHACSSSTFAVNSHEEFLVILV